MGICITDGGHWFLNALAKLTTVLTDQIEGARAANIQAALWGRNLKGLSDGIALHARHLSRLLCAFRLLVLARELLRHAHNLDVVGHHVVQPGDRKEGTGKKHKGLGGPFHARSIALPNTRGKYPFQLKSDTRRWQRPEFFAPFLVMAAHKRIEHRRNIRGDIVIPFASIDGIAGR